MKQTSLLFFALVVLLASCKTDVELNAPYKNTTIIFGLLDPDSNGDGISTVQDTQWIKINKTFLGEGDNNAYAAIRDSSEYKDEDFVRKVVERLVDGDVVETFALTSKSVSNRNVNGVFYGPEQTVYYFIPENGGLNQNSEYRIVLEFADGRVVTATTKMVKSIGLTWISPQPDATIKLANRSSTGNFTYTQEVALRWNAVPNASFYDAKLRFHFTEEVYASNDWSAAPISSTPKFLDFYIGSISEEDITNGQLKLTFDGRSFFSYLKNNLVADPQRIRRIIGSYNTARQRTECFDVVLTMANDDLKSYIQVNSPSTGVVQERPIYSNVSNGIGLFASRSASNLINLPLVSNDNNNQPIKGNLEALCEEANNEYTAGLNFCDPNPGSDPNYRCN